MEGFALRYIAVVCLSLAVAACSASSTASPFEYGPSDVPLRYEVATTGDIVAQTPMGEMASETTSDALVVMEIGDRTESGWPVTAMYERLVVSAQGAMGGGSVNAEGVLGKNYSGVLNQSGLIEITESPEISGRVAANLDPGALLTELLVPMPPEGAGGADTWPVSSTTVSDAAVELISVFEGTARIAGDTVWNGVAATVIVADGVLELEGTGAPTGSPAAMDMLLSGESRRVYVWDSVRRVMLASEFTSNAEGSIAVQGMDISMPASFVTRQTVQIIR